jgi:sialate O-acetylesterase
MNSKHLSIALLLAAGLPSVATFADVHPNPLFSDHMVLQQGVELPVWGTADAGEKVTVTLGSSSQIATAGADGNWMLKLPAQKAAGLDAPATEMTIAGKNSVTVKDVLIGEVWLASGQSNMQFPVSKAKGSYAGLLNEEKEIAAANYPKLRMFTAKNTKSLTPQATVAGQWEICTPENVPAWSAVGYLFGRDLQREIKQPVGILSTAYGASTAEAWISREALAADPLLKPMLDRFDADVAAFKANPAVTLGELPDNAKKPVTINGRPGAATAKLGDPVNDQHQPTVLFNGQLNPLIPYAIKGALWYQGESIVGGTKGLLMYGHVQNALIQDWRSRWGQGEFPFFIAQIPGQQNVSNNPVLREQQVEALKLKNTGIAVIMDTGEAKNVHPHNKAPLGERLTKLALAKAYGQNVEFSGPVFDSLKIDGNKAIVKFTHADGLTAKGGDSLKWFQVAGDDQKFHDATAKIDGDTVIVSSPEVAAPAAVRYAWDNFPEGANLFNKDDLQASPFRTDHWDYPIEGIVESK